MLLLIVDRCVQNRNKGESFSPLSMLALQVEVSQYARVAVKTQLTNELNFH